MKNTLKKYNKSVKDRKKQTRRYEKMNISYACYVANKINNVNTLPSWAKVERYDFCESVTRFFSRLMK